MAAERSLFLLRGGSADAIAKMEHDLQAFADGAQPTMLFRAVTAADLAQLQRLHDEVRG